MREMQNPFATDFAWMDLIIYGKQLLPSNTVTFPPFKDFFTIAFFASETLAFLIRRLSFPDSFLLRPPRAGLSVPPESTGVLMLRLPRSLPLQC